MLSAITCNWSMAAARKVFDATTTTEINTEKVEHDAFKDQAIQIGKLRDLVEKMLKGDVEDGVVTLGQTMVRGSSIETFTVRPAIYRPEPEPM